MKRYIIAVSAFALICSVSYGQSGLLRGLGERAKQAVENNIGGRVEKKVNQAIDNKLNKKEKGKDQAAPAEGEQAASGASKASAGWTCPECGKAGNTGKFCSDCGAKQPAPEAPASDAGWTCPECGKKGNSGKFCADCGAKKPASDAGWTCPECGKKGNTGAFCAECGAKKPGAQAAAQAAPAPRKAIETAYSKTDFVPGDEIFFDDNFEHEKLGEFPLRWDLLSGYAETVTIAGRKCIGFTDDGHGAVKPLMKEEDYLPDVFTLEFDLFVNDASELGEHEVGEHTFSALLVAPGDELVASLEFWFRSGDGGSTLRWTVNSSVTIPEGLTIWKTRSVVWSSIRL